MIAPEFFPGCDAEWIVIALWGKATCGELGEDARHVVGLVELDPHSATNSTPYIMLVDGLVSACECIR